MNADFQNLVARISSSPLILVAGSGASLVASEKLSHSLRSIGIRAFSFATEALLHGDIGALQSGDILIVFSKSGFIPDAPLLRKVSARRGFETHLVTENSSLNSSDFDFVHNLVTTSEKDPFGLIPSTSIIGQIHFGDQIIDELILRTGDRYVKTFAECHPRGGLGSKIATQLKTHEFKSGLALSETDFRQRTLLELEADLNDSLVGLIAILDSRSRLVQVFTDGDIRRLLHDDGLTLNQLVPQHWFDNRLTPIAISETATLGELMELFADNPRVNAIPIVHSDGSYSGVVHARQVIKIFKEINE